MFIEFKEKDKNNIINADYIISINDNSVTTLIGKVETMHTYEELKNKVIGYNVTQDDIDLIKNMHNLLLEKGHEPCSESVQKIKKLVKKLEERK